MRSLRIFMVVALAAFGLMGQVRPVSAASAGDVVVCPESSSVYYLGEDGKRYVYQNEQTYFSWYDNFDMVQTVSCQDLAAFPIAGVVWYQAGTSLVKIPSAPTVYAVEPSGVLRPLASEAEAIALFGSDWADRVDDVSEAFWPQYSVGDELKVGEIPEGTILKDDVGDLFRYQDLDDDNQEEAVEFDELDDDHVLGNFALDLEKIATELGINIERVELEGMSEALIDLLRSELDEDVFVPQGEEVTVRVLNELDQEADNDDDGLSNEEDLDDDDDGELDSEDSDPLDHDNDGTDDAADSDDDEDGIEDAHDSDPLDHDNDGLDDEEDADDDEDGIEDVRDNKNSDHDNDGLEDAEDPDDDEDGIKDVEDADDDENELVKTEATDNDQDGLSDEADKDDDEDGIPDAEDTNPLDHDNDGQSDSVDTESGDGTIGSEDSGSTGSGGEGSGSDND